MHDKHEFDAERFGQPSAEDESEGQAEDGETAKTKYASSQSAGRFSEQPQHEHYKRHSAAHPPGEEESQRQSVRRRRGNCESDQMPDDRGNNQRPAGPQGISEASRQYCSRQRSGGGDGPHDARAVHVQPVKVSRHDEHQVVHQREYRELRQENVKKECGEDALPSHVCESTCDLAQVGFAVPCAGERSDRDCEGERGGRSIEERHGDVGGAKADGRQHYAAKQGTEDTRNIEGSPQKAHCAGEAGLVDRIGGESVVGDYAEHPSDAAD